MSYPSDFEYNALRQAITDAYNRPVQVNVPGGEFGRGYLSSQYGFEAGRWHERELSALQEGDEAKAAYYRAQAQHAEQRAAETAPRVPEATDIGGLGQAVDWGLGAAGQGISSMAQPAVSGLAGAAIGGLAGGAIGGPAGAALGAKALGSISAAYPMFEMERNETIGEALNDEEIRKKAEWDRIRNTANLKGIGAGLLEFAVPAAAAGLLRPLRRGTTGALNRFAGGEILPAMGGEFLTEGAQSLAGQAAQKSLRDESMLGDYDWTQAFNEAMAGAVGGGVMAAPGAAVRGLTQAYQNRQVAPIEETKEEPAEQKLLSAPPKTTKEEETPLTSEEPIAVNNEGVAMKAEDAANYEAKDVAQPASELVNEPVAEEISEPEVEVSEENSEDSIQEKNNWDKASFIDALVVELEKQRKNPQTRHSQGAKIASSPYWLDKDGKELKGITKAVGMRRSLQKNFANLDESNSNFVVVDTAADAVRMFPNDPHARQIAANPNAGWRGFTTTQNGQPKVVLIGENIPQGEELATFLHEAGVHVGMRNSFGAEAITGIANEIRNIAQGAEGIEQGLAARAIQQATGTDFVDEETIAYFVEYALTAKDENGKNLYQPRVMREKNNPIQRILNAIIAYVKRFLESIGLKSKKALSAQELIDTVYGLAQKGVNTMAEQAQEAPVQTEQKVLTYDLSESNKDIELLNNISGLGSELNLDDLTEEEADEVLVRKASDLATQILNKGDIFSPEMVTAAQSFFDNGNNWHIFAEQVVSLRSKEIEHIDAQILKKLFGLDEETSFSVAKLVELAGKQKIRLADRFIKFAGHKIHLKQSKRLKRTAILKKDVEYYFTTDEITSLRLLVVAALNDSSNFSESLNIVVDAFDDRFGDQSVEFLELLEKFADTKNNSKYFSDRARAHINTLKNELLIINEGRLNSFYTALYPLLNKRYADDLLYLSGSGEFNINNEAVANRMRFYLRLFRRYFSQIIGSEKKETMNNNKIIHVSQFDKEAETDKAGVTNYFNSKKRQVLDGLEELGVLKQYFPNETKEEIFNSIKDKEDWRYFLQEVLILPAWGDSKYARWLENTENEDFVSYGSVENIIKHLRPRRDPDLFGGIRDYRIVEGEGVWILEQARKRVPGTRPAIAFPKNFFQNVKDVKSLGTMQQKAWRFLGGKDAPLDLLKAVAEEELKVSHKAIQYKDLNEEQMDIYTELSFDDKAYFVGFYYNYELLFNEEGKPVMDSQFISIHDGPKYRKEYYAIDNSVKLKYEVLHMMQDYLDQTYSKLDQKTNVQYAFEKFFNVDKIFTMPVEEFESIKEISVFLERYSPDTSGIIFDGYWMDEKTIPIQKTNLIRTDTLPESSMSEIEDRRVEFQTVSGQMFDLMLQNIKTLFAIVEIEGRMKNSAEPYLFADELDRLKGVREVEYDTILSANDKIGDIVSGGDALNEMENNAAEDFGAPDSEADSVTADFEVGDDRELDIAEAADEGTYIVPDTKEPWRKEELALKMAEKNNNLQFEQVRLRQSFTALAGDSELYNFGLEKGIFSSKPLKKVNDVQTSLGDDFRLYDRSRVSPDVADEELNKKAVPAFKASVFSRKPTKDEHRKLQQIKRYAATEGYNLKEVDLLTGSVLKIANGVGAQNPTYVVNNMFYDVLCYLTPMWARARLQDENTPTDVKNKIETLLYMAWPKEKIFDEKISDPVAAFDLARMMSRDNSYYMLTLNEAIEGDNFIFAMKQLRTVIGNATLRASIEDPENLTEIQQKTIDKWGNAAVVVENERFSNNLEQFVWEYKVYGAPFILKRARQTNKELRAHLERNSKNPSDTGPFTAFLAGLANMIAAWESTTQRVGFYISKDMLYQAGVDQQWSSPFILFINEGNAERRVKAQDSFRQAYSVSLVYREEKNKKTSVTTYNEPIGIETIKGIFYFKDLETIKDPEAKALTFAVKNVIMPQKEDLRDMGYPEEEVEAFYKEIGVLALLPRFLELTEGDIDYYPLTAIEAMGMYISEKNAFWQRFGFKNSHDAAEPFTKRADALSIYEGLVEARRMQGKKVRETKDNKEYEYLTFDMEMLPLSGSNESALNRLDEAFFKQHKEHSKETDKSRKIARKHSEKMLLNLIKIFKENFLFAPEAITEAYQAAFGFGENDNPLTFVAQSNLADPNNAFDVILNSRMTAIIERADKYGIDNELVQLVKKLMDYDPDTKEIKKIVPENVERYIAENKDGEPSYRMKFDLPAEKVKILEDIFLVLANQYQTKEKYKDKTSLMNRTDYMRDRSEYKKTLYAKHAGNIDVKEILILYAILSKLSRNGEQYVGVKNERYIKALKNVGISLDEDGFLKKEDAEKIKEEFGILNKNFGKNGLLSLNKVEIDKLVQKGVDLFDKLPQKRKDQFFDDVANFRVEKELEDTWDRQRFTGETQEQFALRRNLRVKREGKIYEKVRKHIVAREHLKFLLEYLKPSEEFKALRNGVKFWFLGGFGTPESDLDPAGVPIYFRYKVDPFTWIYNWMIKELEEARYWPKLKKDVLKTLKQSPEQWFSGLPVEQKLAIHDETAETLEKYDPDWLKNPEKRQIVFDERLGSNPGIFEDELMRPGIELLAALRMHKAEPFVYDKKSKERVLPAVWPKRENFATKEDYDAAMKVASAVDAAYTKGTHIVDTRENNIYGYSPDFVDEDGNWTTPDSPGAIETQSHKMKADDGWFIPWFMPVSQSEYFFLANDPYSVFSRKANVSQWHEDMYDVQQMRDRDWAEQADFFADQYLLNPRRDVIEDRGRMRRKDVPVLVGPDAELNAPWTNVASWGNPKVNMEVFAERERLAPTKRLSHFSDVFSDANKLKELINTIAKGKKFVKLHFSSFSTPTFLNTEPKLVGYSYIDLRGERVDLKRDDINGFGGGAYKVVFGRDLDDYKLAHKELYSEDSDEPLGVEGFLLGSKTKKRVSSASYIFEDSIERLFNEDYKGEYGALGHDSEFIWELEYFQEGFLVKLFGGDRQRAFDYFNAYKAKNSFFAKRNYVEELKDFIFQKDFKFNIPVEKLNDGNYLGVLAKELGNEGLKFLLRSFEFVRTRSFGGQYDISIEVPVNELKNYISSVLSGAEFRQIADAFIRGSILEPEQKEYFEAISKLPPDTTFTFDDVVVNEEMRAITLRNEGYNVPAVNIAVMAQKDEPIFVKRDDAWEELKPNNFFDLFIARFELHDDPINKKGDVHRYVNFTHAWETLKSGKFDQYAYDDYQLHRRENPRSKFEVNEKIAQQLMIAILETAISNDIYALKKLEDEKYFKYVEFVYFDENEKRRKIAANNLEKKKKEEQSEDVFDFSKALPNAIRTVLLKLENENKDSKITEEDIALEEYPESRPFPLELAYSLLAAEGTKKEDTPVAFDVTALFPKNILELIVAQKDNKVESRGNAYRNEIFKIFAPLYGKENSKVTTDVFVSKYTSQKNKHILMVPRVNVINYFNLIKGAYAANKLTLNQKRSVMQLGIMLFDRLDKLVPPRKVEEKTKSESLGNAIWLEDEIYKNRTRRGKERKIVPTYEEEIEKLAGKSEKPKRIVFFDVETTGLDSMKDDRIIQFAFTEYIDGKLGRTITSLVNPEGKHISKGATLSHGYTDDDVAHKPLLKEFLNEITEFIKGSELIAHNAKFDVEFLNNELLRNDLKPLSEIVGAITDTLELSIKKFPSKNKHTLNAMRVLFGIHSDRLKHDAAADTEILQQLYEKLTAAEERNFKNLLDRLKNGDNTFALPSKSNARMAMTSLFKNFFEKGAELDAFLTQVFKANRYDKETHTIKLSQKMLENLLKDSEELYSVLNPKDEEDAEIMNNMTATLDRLVSAIVDDEPKPSHFTTTSDNVAQSKKDAVDYLNKVLGDSVEVAFHENTWGETKSQVGSFTEKDGKNLISLALSGNVLSTAHHEAAHALMSTLRKDAPQHYEKLLDYSAKYKDEIIDILTKHGAGKAVESATKDAEEMAAYAYQLAMAGLLPTNALSKRVVGKLGRMWLRVAGLFNDAMRRKANDSADLLEAENNLHLIYKRFNEGGLAHSKDAFYRQLDADLAPKRRWERWNKAAAAFGKFFDNILAASDTVLRRSDIPELEEIADMFYVDVGEHDMSSMHSKGEKGGALSRYRQLHRIWTNRYHNLTKEYAKEEKAAIRKALLNKDRNMLKDERLRKGYDAYREFFDGVFNEFNEMGVENRVKDSFTGKRVWRKFDYANDYMPFLWDRDAVRNNRIEFTNLLTEEVKAAVEAGRLKIPTIDKNAAKLEYPERTYAESIVSEILGENRDDHADSAFWVDKGTFKQNAERYLDFVEDRAKFDKFLSGDIDDMVFQYSMRTSKNAVFQQVFGKDLEKLNALLAKARESVAKKYNLSGKELDERMAHYEHAIHSMMGMLGQDMSPQLRTINSYGAMYQNVRLLAMVLFSSIQDIAGLRMHGGTLKDQWDGLVRGLKSGVKVALNKDDRDKWMQRAEEFGIVPALSNPSIIQELAGTQDIEGKAGAFNRGFFRYILMEGWTRGTRAQAAIIAERKILEWKEKGVDRANKGDVLTFERCFGNMDPKDIKTDGVYLENNEANRIAMDRLCNDMVMNPTEANKPLWANDPRFILFAQLKTFSYTIHRVLLRGIIEQIRQGNIAPAVSSFAGLIPTALAGYLVKEAILSAVTGDDDDDWKWKWDSMMPYVINRSGAFGIPQMFWEDKSDPANLFGPTIGQIQDIASIPIRGQFGTNWSHTPEREALSAMPAGTVLKRFYDAA